MEVARRRIVQKNLEPARPLRRIFNIEPLPCAPTLIEAASQNETYIGIEQFFKVIQLHTKKEERISYSRDFLIGLARHPESRKRPEFLPEHPVVLANARDPEHLWHNEKWN